MTESRECMLINQIVDGEESPQQWREFTSLADADPAHWKELAQMQRDHAAISRALRETSSLADSVALSDIDEQAGDAPVVHTLKFNRLGAFTGWAVAALVAILASVQQQPFSSHSSSPSSEPRVQQAGFSTAAEAFQAYLNKGLETGEVVAEIPDRVLIDSKPALSGNGIEVIYVRQVMERIIVPDLYKVSGQDEIGRPTLVRYQHSVPNPM